MELRSHHPESDVFTDGDVVMSAAQSLVEDLFADADNDSFYHHSLLDVRRALANDGCLHKPEEIAERILAWSGAF